MVKDYVSKDAIILGKCVALLQHLKKNQYLAVVLDEPIVDGYCNVYKLTNYGGHGRLEIYTKMKPFMGMASYLF